VRKGKNRIRWLLANGDSGRKRGTYPAIFCVTRLVLESIHGVTPGIKLVTIAVYNSFHHQCPSDRDFCSGDSLVREIEEMACWKTLQSHLAPLVIRDFENKNN